MSTEGIKAALAGLDASTRTRVSELLSTFCGARRVEARLFDVEDLATAIQDALVADGGRVGTAQFVERLHGVLDGYVHERLVERSREVEAPHPGMDPAALDPAFVAALEERFGKTPPPGVSLYVYAILDGQSDRTFEVELWGRKVNPESTIDPSDGPLGQRRDPIATMREAIGAGRIGVNESSGGWHRRVPLAAFAALLEWNPPIEVIGPMAVR